MLSGREQRPLVTHDVIESVPTRATAVKWVFARVDNLKKEGMVYLRSSLSYMAMRHMSVVVCTSIVVSSSIPQQLAAALCQRNGVRLGSANLVFKAALPAASVARVAPVCSG